MNKTLTDLKGKKYAKIKESESYSYMHIKNLTNNLEIDYLLVIDSNDFEVAKFYKNK